MSGIQFAWSTTVDRLRAGQGTDEARVYVLSTPDPANPYGALLPWPENRGRPRRAVGTKVVLVDGHPVFFLEKGGKKLTTFPKADDSPILELALAGLREIAATIKGRTLRLQEIDGESALKSPLASKLLAFGFRDSYHGLSFMDMPS